MPLRIRNVLIVFVLFGSFAAANAHEHEDLVVGRTGSGQLEIEFAHWAGEHALPPASGLVNGYAGDHPGFAHLEADEPAEDFYTLADGADIWFEVVSFETAFKVYDGGFAGGPYQSPGDLAQLGGDHLHTHLEWVIDADDAGFDPLDSPWQATFKLVDQGTTQYADSPEYTLTFTPEPGVATLIGLGGLMLARRRQS
jgi:hypothetical protein